MRCATAAIASLALLLAVSQARAECRTVLIQVKQEMGRASITIHSDDKKDRRSSVSLPEAVKAIKGMTGWGSSVGVYVTSDKGVRQEDLKKLFDAIEGNFWLDLTQSGGEIPKHLRDHFLKDGKR
jgi:hypothetical protein